MVSWNQFTNLMVFGSRLALFRQLAEVINATAIINLFKSLLSEKFDWIFDLQLPVSVTKCWLGCDVVIHAIHFVQNHFLRTNGKKCA